MSNTPVEVISLIDSYGFFVGFTSNGIIFYCGIGYHVVSGVLERS